MTQATTLTLTDFLLARIAEDEAVLRDACSDTRIDDEPVTPAHEAVWRFDPYGEIQDRPLGRTTVALDYRRFGAECEAKRRIVEMTHGSADFHQGVLVRDGYQPFHTPSIDVMTRVRQLLALPYADHPDYRPEWRP